ncbi:killer cell lectin-like receptor subfamily B member 1B allele A isoform 2-T2 [Acridotheres tristis]
MAENVLYADLKLSEPSRPRILTVPDVQGKSHCSRALSPRVAALAAVLVVMILVVLIALYLTLTGRQQDSTTVTSTSQNVSTKLPPGHGEAPGKSCCSTTRVAVLVTEIILLLLIVVFQIFPCPRHCSRAHIAVLLVVLVLAVLALALSWTLPGGPSTNNHQGSTTTIPEEAIGCPPPWKKHGRKCYFFSPERKWKDWKSCREECTAMGSDLVIIESREELDYLHSQSRHAYYLLGLSYSPEEKKWKWINNVEHDPAMFNIIGPDAYHCTSIGYGEVGTAPCHGSHVTQNLCEKAARMSKRHQKES